MHVKEHSAWLLMVLVRGIGMPCTHPAYVHRAHSMARCTKVPPVVSGTIQGTQEHNKLHQTWGTWEHLCRVRTSLLCGEYPQISLIFAPEESNPSSQPHCITPSLPTNIAQSSSEGMLRYLKRGTIHLQTETNPSIAPEGSANAFGSGYGLKSRWLVTPHGPISVLRHMLPQNTSHSPNQLNVLEVQLFCVFLALIAGGMLVSASTEDWGRNVIGYQFITPCVIKLDVETHTQKQ